MINKTLSKGLFIIKFTLTLHQQIKSNNNLNTHDYEDIKRTGRRDQEHERF